MLSILSWAILLVTTTTVVESLREGVFDNELYESVLDHELCQQQLRHMWPLEFYDASFRVPQGFLTGHFENLGEYNQCLRINQESEVGPIQGKFCMMGIALEGRSSINVPVFTGSSWPKNVGWTEVNVTRTTDLRKYEAVISKLAFLAGTGSTLQRSGDILGAVPMSLAICIPKACSVADVMDPIVNRLLPFSFVQQYCRLPDDKPLSGADYAAMAILSVIGFLTLLSTGYDLCHTFILKSDPASHSKLLSCFSVYKNTNRLFTITTNPGSLDCLDGMRSISILWIILGHVYTNYLGIYSTNLLQFEEWFNKRRAIWLLSADVSVDTFFTMSGLLLVYTTARKMNQKKLLLNIHWFYLHRLLRMFPLLALGVLLQASVFFRVTDGPNWALLAGYVDNCRHYWWSALLYTQNWVNTFTMCLPQTWYLSVDMQLHIASPLLLFWALGSRRLAWSSLTIGLLAILTASTIYCFLKEFYDYEQYFRNYYCNTLIRAPPFIVGMLCGYLLHTLRGKKVQISKYFVAVGYLLAWAASSYVMYQEYRHWESTLDINLNISFVKTLWALSLCWLVFACVSGYGGPINWFLSITPWKFMARISYAMYIFHFSIMYTHAASLTSLYYYSMENTWFTFAAVTVYTVIVSTTACILVDAPFSTLQKMMMDALTSSRTEKSKENKTKTENPDVKSQDASVDRELQESKH